MMERVCSICGVMILTRKRRMAAKITSYGFECGNCRWLSKKPKRPDRRSLLKRIRKS